jgi:4-amino-4-deoxy-L-arabinose transferase-like glycosyltransferase
MDKCVKIISKQMAKPLFLLIFPLILYLVFSTHNLTKFVTADEHFWFNDPTHDRIHQYWNAVSTKNWIATRINDKPGVSLVFISGIGVFFEKQMPTLLAGYWEGGDSNIGAQNFEKLNFLYRFPQVIFTAIFSIYFFWALRRLLKNDWAALFSAGLIMLSPIIIGISQIVNPDAMLWIFCFATLLAFLLFLQEEKKLDIFLAAVFFAFALLSKYAALMLIPFFMAAMFFQALFEFENWSKKILQKKLFHFSLGYFFVITLAFAIFAILMPAVLVKPLLAYKSTIGFKGMQYVFWPLMAVNLFLVVDSFYFKSFCAEYILQKTKFLKKILPRALYGFLVIVSLLTLANWIFKNNLMNVVSAAFDSGDGEKYIHASFFDKLILQFRPIVFSLTPLALASILFLWTKAFFGKIKYELLVFLFTLFIAIFYIAVIKQGLLISIRYGIILYPALLTLAALGIIEFFKLEKRTEICKSLIFLAVIIISFISLWKIKPYYFNYTSDLMPKNSIITGAWGYGGYEAAEYLNSLPNAKDLVIWSDYYGVCPFFVGKCLEAGALSNYAKSSSLSSVDYMVATRRGKLQNKNMWHKFDSYKIKATWSLFIDGREGNFVKIYKKEGLAENGQEGGIF